MFEEIERDAVGFNVINLDQAFDIFYLFLFGIFLAILILLVEYIFIWLEHFEMFAKYPVEMIISNMIVHGYYQVKMKLN